MSVQFLGWVVEQFSVILAPLRTSLDSPSDFATFMQSYGWDVDPNSFVITDVQNGLAIVNDLQTAAQIVGQLYDPANQEPLDQYVQLVTTLSDAVGKLRDLASQSGGAPAGIPAGAWSDFVAALLDGLFEDYLEVSWPSLAAFLMMAGVITKTQVNLTGTAGRVSYTKKTIAWSDLAQALTQPSQLFAQTFSWNQSGQTFDFQQVLDRMSQALPLLGVTANSQPPSQALLDTYYSSTNPARPNVMELLLSLLHQVDSGNNVLFDLSLSILPIPPSGQLDQAPVGVSLGPAITGSGSMPSSALGPLQLALAGAFQSDGGLRADVRPGGVGVTLAAGGGTALDEELTASSTFSGPSILLGSEASNRVQLGSWSLGLNAVGSPSAPEIQLELNLQHLTLVVDFSDADGFLQTVLGSGTQSVDLSLDVLWSSRTGLGFSGQAQLAAAIPVHVTILDIITIDTVYVAIDAGTSGAAAASVAVTGGLQLGPISAAVDKIGVQAALAHTPPGQQAGLFGNMDLQFGFKPPDGLGIAVDAAVASGGGYIEFDPTNSQYGGVFAIALELPIVSVQVDVAGLLNTKLPGGQSGFSLLFILVAQFDPGFELGFGFTLDAVGGLVGINRSMAFDALTAAFKSHALETIFFPPDPQTAIANAPQTLSDLSSIFPITVGHYVFGPMLGLGWGTPLIVSAEFGGVLELPTFRLALFGLFAVALPTLEETELAIVLIHIDILGEIDFQQETLSIDGDLYDSEVEGWTLSGQMALRLGWGSTPEFALSVGGLNPQFQPPAGFPTLQRLMISLGSGGVSISLATYFAVTSNSVQVGADLELHASAAGFTVHGYMGFDALFIFSPFSFAVDMRAGVDVLKGGTVLLGIDLDLTLSGPQPWHAHGDAKFHVLFISVSVGVDVTVGNPAQAPPLPTTNVWPLLQTALQDPGNWSAVLPSDTARCVSLSQAPAGSQTLLVHPMGQLTVRQKVVPLDFQISMFGSAAPGDYNQFQVQPPTLDGAQPAYQVGQDFFAPGQFEALSDGDKLSKPSYQQFDATISFGSTEVASGSGSLLDVHYETYYVEDQNIPAKPLTRAYRPLVPTQLALAGQGAAAQSSARGTGSTKYVVPGLVSPITVSAPAYAIASTVTLQVNTSLSVPGGTSQAAAEGALEAHLSAHPEDIGMLQVIPLYEAAA
jgi:hypothetical protein